MLVCMRPDLPQTEIAIVEMTNAFRKASALQEVKPNAAARRRGSRLRPYLAKSGKFAHEADGRAARQARGGAGYRYCMVAENLALNLDSRGFETRSSRARSWRAGRTRPAIARTCCCRGATEIGVAVVRAPDKDPKFISVQLFGRPEA